MSDLVGEGSAERPVRFSPRRRIVEVGWPTIIPVVFEFTGFPDSVWEFISQFPDKPANSEGGFNEGQIDKAKYRDYWFWAQAPDLTLNAIPMYVRHGFTPTGAYHFGPPGVTLYCDTGFQFAGACWLPAAPQTIYATSWKYCGIINFRHVDKLRLKIKNEPIDLSSGNILVPDYVLDETFPYTMNYSLRRYNGTAIFSQHADRTITTDDEPLWTATGTLTGEASTLNGFGEFIDFTKDGVIPTP